MSDKDREAFEHEAAIYFGQHTLKRTNYLDGHYVDQTINDAWLLWQAACDHYAPKLTENKSADVVLRAIHKAADLRMDTCFTISEAVIKALRAAGIRFKEEA